MLILKRSFRIFYKHFVQKLIFSYQPSDPREFQVETNFTLSFWDQMYLWEKLSETILSLLFKGYFTDKVLHQGVIHSIARAVLTIGTYGSDFFPFKTLLEHNVNKTCDVVFGNISKIYLLWTVNFNQTIINKVHIDCRGLNILFTQLRPDKTRMKTRMNNC